jgi:hypothetical protein
LERKKSGLRPKVAAWRNHQFLDGAQEIEGVTALAREGKPPEEDLQAAMDA